jgi:hypothetical protein
MYDCFTVTKKKVRIVYAIICIVCTYIVRICIKTIFFIYHCCKRCTLYIRLSTTFYTLFLAYSTHACAIFPVYARFLLVWDLQNRSVSALRFRFIEVQRLHKTIETCRNHRKIPYCRVFSFQCIINFI